MIRQNPPFNGMRYLLNLNTGEIHDLEKEATMCNIDDIKSEHICMCNNYDEAQISAAILCPNHLPNGCYFCNPSKDRG